VPFAFVFTGLHKDYHQVGDNPDKPIAKKLQYITTGMFSAYRIAK